MIEASCKISVVDSAEWKRRIDEMREEEAQVFTTAPRYVTAAFNREKAHKEDYHGRELLELLQNADDHGPKGRTGKILISISKAGLCFANTGLPFPVEGVQSLVVPNHSPKALDQTKYIGNKGLGFRSILNWTNAPFVLSGSMRLGFNRDRTIEWLEALCSKHPAVEAEVERYRSAGITAPVATLACPFFIDSNEYLNLEPHSATLLDEADAIIQQGFQTVVGLPMTSNMMPDLERQIQELIPEVLLFLKSVSEVTILQGPLTKRIRLTELPDGRFSATLNGTHYNNWQVWHRDGVLPEDLIDRANSESRNFHIAIAVPENKTETGKLFVHLPTDCTFPLPLIAHATLKTDQSRNHIDRNDSNKHVIAQLADLVADVAVETAAKSGSWEGLELVEPKSSFDKVFEEAGFVDRLVNRLQVSNVVPCLDGTLRSPAKVMAIDVSGIHPFLPSKFFKDICLPPPDSVQSAFRALKIPSVYKVDLCSRLSQISPILGLERRVEILRVLWENGMLSRAPLPNLLLDSNNNVASSTDRLILPPTVETELSMPDWVPVKLASHKLWSKLRIALKADSDNSLRGRLDGYPLTRYGFDAMTTAVQAEVNRQIKTDPDATSTIRRRALQAYYDLYVSGAKGEDVSKPRDLDIWVPRVDGTYSLTSDLYFGEGYKRGKLCAELLPSVNPSPFVMDSIGLGLGEYCEEFLYWAGVADRPRIESKVLKKGQHIAFFTHLTQNLKIPHVFQPNDYVGKSGVGLLDHWLEIEAAQIPQYLNEIVSGGRPEAIMAWLQTDHRMLQLRTGDVESQLKLTWGAKYSARTLQDQTLPSFAWWTLMNLSWMPVSNGERLKTTCTAFGTRGNEELIELIPSPSLDQSAMENLRSGFPTIIDLRSLLRILGVADGISELPWDVLFDLAKSLPTISRDGRLTRALYSAIYSKAVETASGLEAVEIPQDLMLWGTHGGESNYFRADELLYNPNLVIPKTLESHFKLFDYPKKQGARIIRQVFGVNPLRREDLNLITASYERNPSGRRLEQEIEELKPYALALKLDADASGQHKRRLQSLQVKVCLVIRATSTVGGKAVNVEMLEDGEYIINGENSLLVLSQDLANRGICDPIVANHVSTLLSAALETESMPELAQIATARHSDRLKLFRDLRDSNADQQLAEAAKRLKLDLFDSTISVQPAPLVAESKQTPKFEAPNNLLALNNIGTENRTDIQQSDQQRPASTLDLDNMKAGQKELPEGQRRPQIPIRYQATRGPVSAMRTTSPVDPIRSQCIAAAFERGQGRLPLEVDSTQGTQGPRCDILSFVSEQDLKDFQETRKTKYIHRFIEVKGSSHSQGLVTLTGNELDAAQEHGERYFLYRVHEDAATGTASLVILRNPASVRESVQININMFLQREGAESWELSNDETQE
jgi:hypothetical protein